MSDHSRPLVLVIDDERDIRVALEDLLEQRFRVVSFAEPAAALARLARANDVSVILSDQRMPGMTGNRFLADARKHSDAEAILLTGYADLDAVISAINEGRVAAYVHKPWDSEALLATVSLAAERHDLRRAVELERRLFDGLMAGSTDAITLADAAGRVLRANRSEPRALDDADRAVQATQVAGSEEREDGEQWLRIQRVPIADGNGGTMLLRLESDVSRERLLERRARQSEKLQALGTLAGGIAHDFNNLLTAVIGNLDLAVHRPDHPSAPRFVSGALDAAKRGVALTARLLSFSRQRTAAPQAVDLGLLIDGMADLLERTLGTGITVAREGCPPGLLVTADANQLELAILNLCVNARDAMDGQGCITLSCEPITVADDPDLAAGDYATIAVADTGTGIAPETIARVFEPFFTTKPVGKGTGLGLSMAYGLATGLGGTVRIQSRVGEGSSVTIVLPRAEGDASNARDEPGTPVSPAITKPLAILLVEDDPAVRDVTRGYLEDLGHKVVDADGPAAARRTLGTTPVELVITDFVMPGGSGLDILREVRAKHRDLPVLLLTGFADVAIIPSDVHRLGKPFTRDGLAAAIAAVVG